MRTHSTSNETVEMYLKTIAELSEDDQPVIIARVAERLGVTPVSANEMMKRLVEQELIVHERYKGVRLTADGRYMANSVIRRQRLWECFLVDHLHFNWSGVYEAACRLEHATSKVLAEALSSYLGHPQFCPHGNPIPRVDGSVELGSGCPLSTLKVGEKATVTRIAPMDTEIFAYLNQHGLTPQQEITVVERAPMDGPITVRHGSGEVALGLALAAMVMVKPG